MGRLSGLDSMLRSILLGYPHAWPRHTEGSKRVSHGVNDGGCGTSDTRLVLFPIDPTNLVANLCNVRCTAGSTPGLPLQAR